MATDLKPDVLFTESPASWNTRYVTPEGYACQITLRGENGKDLLEKASIALSYLADHSFLPDPGYHKNGSGNGGNGGNTGNSNGESKICPVHGCEMKRREKDGSIFYSHKTENGWCYGKVRKNGGTHE